jgi:hypothetical protein
LRMNTSATLKRWLAPRELAPSLSVADRLLIA